MNYTMTYIHCSHLKSFTASQIVKYHHYLSRAALALSLAILPGLAKAEAIGFEGPFSAWTSNCNDVFDDFACGSILAEASPGQARINMTLASDENDYQGLTSWSNTVQLSTAYDLVFSLAFTDGNQDQIGETYGFFNINGTQIARVSAGDTPPLITQRIDAGQTLTFGVFSSNELADIAMPSAYVSVSGFSATPVKAPVIPAPLPAIGAASLFLGSRRLRRRIRRKTFLEASEPLFGSSVLRCNRQNLGR
jgi:hypothetical protein